jgi:pilus assembly protein CpaF
VLGEIRGDEATELLQALNTGHDGSLATVHANGPDDALARIESLVVRSNSGWPMSAVRDQVHRCIDVVVHVQRSPTGQRRVAQVAEVSPCLPMTDVGAGSRVKLLATHDVVVGSLQRGRR